MATGRNEDRHARDLPYGPITVATAFGSIVSLLGLWKAEVGERKGRDLGEYIEWLRRKEHTQLVDLVEGNSELSTSLRVLVEDQYGQVMKKLGELEQVLMGVARNLVEFQPLADAMVITSGLSDQARSILHQMNEADVSKFLEVETMHDTEFPFLDGHSGQLTIDEPRFIDSDLETLVNLGLLLLDNNASGDRYFTITRAGAAVGG